MNTNRLHVTTGEASIICPFYTGQEADHINCEGISKNSHLAIRFDRKDQKIKWQEEKCSQFDYQNKCKMAEIILRYNDELEKRERGKLAESNGKLLQIASAWKGVKT
jgi:hypothetical protein